MEKEGVEFKVKKFNKQLKLMTEKLGWKMILFSSKKNGTFIPPLSLPFQYKYIISLKWESFCNVWNVYFYTGSSKSASRSPSNSPPPHPYSISRIHSNSHSSIRTSPPMPISLTTTTNSPPSSHNMGMHSVLNHNDGSRSPTNYIPQGYGSPTGWSSTQQ